MVGDGLGEMLNSMLDNYPLTIRTLCDIFMTPICGGKVFGGHPVKMFHRHDDYARPQPHLENPEECSCSILELIIRYSASLSREHEEESQIGELLMKLSGYKPFKMYYCVASFKLYRFYFDINTTSAEIQQIGAKRCTIAGLLNQKFQLIGSAEYSLLGAQSYDVNKFFDSIAYLFEKFVDLRDYTRSVYMVPMSVLSTLFEWACLKDAVTDIILTPGYIPGFINCIKILQKCRFSYKLADQEFLEDQQLNRVVRQIRFESDILNKIKSELCLEYRDAFHKEGTASQDMLLAMLKECVLAILELNQDPNPKGREQESREAFAALETIFVLTAVTFQNLTYQSTKLVQCDLDMGRLELMNEAIFESTSQMERFYAILARNLARVTGFIRQANKNGIWVSRLVLT